MHSIVDGTLAANAFVDNLLLQPVSIFALVAISLYLTMRARPRSAKRRWLRR
jgi:hypothetical protein